MDVQPDNRRRDAAVGAGSRHPDDGGAAMSESRAFFPDDEYGESACAGRPSAPAVADLLLGAMPIAVLTLDPSRGITTANPAAEQLLGAGSAFLTRHRLDELISPDSPVIALVDLALRGGAGVSEYGVVLSGPRLPERLVDVYVTLLGNAAGDLLVCFVERSMARLIDRHLNHRSAARSVTGMAAVLAHELKNPLSGIRGAAQLIERTVEGPERELAQMICEETDRIRDLVERVDVFSDDRPPTGERVNVHRVLEHVRRLQGSTAGAGIRFIERYDPSLPPVWGNRDQLVQVFLNIMKNALEAAPERGGKIVLSTRYRHGFKFASGGGKPLDLPIVVAIEDNGSGIPEDLRDNLFEPFVTTKRDGAGLGLALVANIVENHGGVVEFEAKRGRTVFRVRLPAMADDG